MKISIIFCTIVFTIMNTVAFGQTSNPTRKQTETWLLEKMNKYVSPISEEDKQLELPQINYSKKTAELRYSDIRFEFVDDNLIIRANVTKTDYNQDGNPVTTFSRKVTIPLYDLDGNNYFYYSSFFFSTIHTFIKIEDSNGKYETTSCFRISCKTDSEFEFTDRFDKAMNYLRKFVKKPKSTEIF